MEPRDIGPEIAEIARHYDYHKMPAWLTRIQELLQQAWQWLMEMLDLLFKHRGHGTSDSRALSTLMQFALYIAGFIALVFIAYILWKRAVNRKQSADGSRQGAASIEKILDSQGYFQESESLAAKSDYRGACRSLYLSLLQVFHEECVANFSPAKTNYEYRYLLSKHPQLLESFMRFAEIVEQCWFGNKAAGSEDYRECREIYQVSLSEAETIGERIRKIAQENAEKL